jgi:hypothetical protein
MKLQIFSLAHIFPRLSRLGKIWQTSFSKGVRFVRKLEAEMQWFPGLDVNLYIYWISHREIKDLQQWYQMLMLSDGDILRMGLTPVTSRLFSGSIEKAYQSMSGDGTLFNIRCRNKTWGCDVWVTKIKEMLVSRSSILFNGPLNLFSNSFKIFLTFSNLHQRIHRTLKTVRNPMIFEE